MKRIFKALIDARQRQANREVARMLHRTEYRGEDYEFILARLNAGEVNW